MKVLVLNCGSSSIKYKLFDMTSGEVMAQGGIEKIGLPGAFLKLTDKDGKKVVLEKEGSDAYAHHQHYERAHDFEQGYPGRFHGGELEFFAEVAERH